MVKRRKKRKSSTIYSIFGKLSDILFIPILLIAVFTSFSTISVSKKSTPTTVFGYSLVNILSPSMTATGFNVGDTVLTTKTSISDLKLGDIISFYNYSDTLDYDTVKHEVLLYNYVGGVMCDMSEENIRIGEGYEGQSQDELYAMLGELRSTPRDGEKSVESAIKYKANVFFHQVIGIYVDDFGNIFYKTKGSSNNYADQPYTRSDFVVGKYVNTPVVLRSIIKFVTSLQGMLLFVCFPLSILVLMDCFSLIEQVEVMTYENSIVSEKVRIYEDDLKKNYDPNEMDLPNKVLVYYNSPPDRREFVKNRIWGKILDPTEDLTKKEQRELMVMQSATAKLEHSIDDYWIEWINASKGGTKRTLKKMYDKIEFDNALRKLKKTI